MPQILLQKSDEAYLQKCVADLNFTFGIIIGQQAEVEKYLVVHLAKNGDEEVDLIENESQHQAALPKNVEDINTQALTNQWISASKMIPGSFVVLGVFVAGNAEKIVEEETTFKTAKNLLYDVHNLLQQGNNFCGSADEVTKHDYLFLAYTTSGNKAVCKSYTHSSNGGAFSPMDVRFVEKPFQWYTLETSYELNDTFPILEDTPKVNIERQFQRTIAAVKKRLRVSEIFLQNESVDETITLEAYVKRKGESRKGLKEEPVLKASIFLPLKCHESEDPVKVRCFNGTIRLVGVISSRIWCSPRNTLAVVKRYIRDDVLRSLAARIQVYCDGLTNPNVSSDAIFISEPPRRVYFHLSETQLNPIQFSEYIFRGEAPTVAVAQAKQILDLDINSENILTDLEGLPDENFDEISSLDIQSTTSVKQAKTYDLAQNMYMLGIAVALLVLLVSVLLHYTLQKPV